MLGVGEFESRRGLRIFIFATASRPALGANLACCPVGSGGKAAGAWSWPLTSI